MIMCKMMGMIQPESIWENYGLQTLQQELDRLFPEYDISMNRLLEQLLQGDILGSITGLMQSSVHGFLGYFDSLKNILIWLLILGLASSLITHFAEIFDKHQISDLSFFFLYLLFMTVLLKCYQETAAAVIDLLENIVLFMKLMIPTYMLAVGVASGISTVSVTYQVMLVLIYIVENFLQEGILPFVQIYMFLIMMNGIWVEEKLALLIELIKKGIGTALKASVGVVTGISVFQSMITPAINSVKSTVLQKVISAIPGIGNAAEGAMELVLGAAVIIKNSIGIICLLILLIICAAPLAYIFILAWILRVAAAILGLVSDKRLISCTNQMGEACMLLFRTAATAVLLFLISISVIALTTGRVI